jgi:hypothetical protein
VEVGWAATTMTTALLSFARGGDVKPFDPATTFVACMHRDVEAARFRSRNCGRSSSLTKAHVRLAQAAMGQPEPKVGDLCSELEITRVTLCRYVGPRGESREYARRVLGS